MTVSYILLFSLNYFYFRLSSGLFKLTFLTLAPIRLLEGMALLKCEQNGQRENLSYQSHLVSASPSATGENVHSLPWRYGSSCSESALLTYLASSFHPFPPHHYSNVPNSLQIPDTACYSCLLAVCTLPLARDAFRHSGKEGSTCLL